MGVLKIKVNNIGNADDWETIDNLKLDNLSLKTGTNTDGTSKYEEVNDVIKNAAVDVYIHVDSDGTNYTSTDPEITDTGLTLMDWFNEAYPISNSELRNKAIKGFLIEHRTTGESTYHLPYYWNSSASEWTPLNAIWG